MQFSLIFIVLSWFTLTQSENCGLGYCRECEVQASDDKEAALQTCTSSITPTNVNSFRYTVHIYFFFINWYQYWERSRIYYISCGSCSSNQYLSGCVDQSTSVAYILVVNPYTLPSYTTEYCVPCGSCSDSQVRINCENKNPGTCTCAKGYATASCTACTVGYYKNEIGSGQCTQCPTGQYQSLQAQTACISCPTVTLASGKVVQSYADTSGSSACSSCTQWTANANAGQYISPCTSTANYQTLSCPLCASGKYSDKDCSTTTTGRVYTASELPVCTNCPAGTFFAAPASGGLQTTCTTCTTGTYQTGTGMSVCTACASASLPANAQHEPWGSTVPSVSTCPNQCNAGYFKSGTSCTACGAGTYSLLGATACTGCTNKPTNSYYLAVTGPRTDMGSQCKWSCNSGYERSGTACSACNSGFYSIQTRTDDSVAEISCSQCTACVSGTNYETTSCTTSRNRVCTGCRTTCGVGNYISASCTVTANAQCTSCTTNCGVNKYLNDECPGTGTSDVVRCLDCVVNTDCAFGITYLPVSCTGTGRSPLECQTCTQRNCVDSYASQCTLTTDSVCTPYTTCTAGNYLKNFGQRQDGVCTPCSICQYGIKTACSARADVVCLGQPCNSTSPCDDRYFCNFGSEADSGTCSICPKGYSSDGWDCKPCPDLETCDEFGRVVCRGELSPFKRGVCLDGFVSDAESCSSPITSTILTVTRGGYIYSNDTNCYPYFECLPGHYHRYSTSLPEVTCQTCNPNANLLMDYISWGLQANNPGSCISDCRYGMNLATEACNPAPNLQLLRYNSPGQYYDGTFLQSCNAGYTSQRGLAVALSDCVQCDVIPNTIGDLCGEYLCTPPWYKRGRDCFLNLICPREGFTEGCVPNTLPFQPAGKFKIGTLLTLDEPVNFAENFLRLGSVTTFTTVKFGITQRHRLVHSGVTRYAPGRICSGAVRGSFVYVVFCNATFITFYNMGIASPQPRLLIGRNESGYKEDYKLEAKFGSELYIAAHPTQDRLFVVDRFNCVLREVFIKQPGHYLTRSHLVYGTPNTCYGDFSLQWPVGIFPVLSSSYFFIPSEDGLYQLHTETLRVRLAVPRFKFDTSKIKAVSAQNTSMLSLYFLDRTEHLAAASEICLPGTTSLLGGDCSTPCILGQYYVNEVSGLCLPCFTRECLVGEESVECTPTSAQFCRPCPALSSASARYYLPDNCLPTNVYYVHPCPRNMYLQGQVCVSCPPYSETAFTGAISVEECRCFEGVERITNQCKIGQLYRLPYPPKCPLLTYPRGLSGACETCMLPPLPGCVIGEYTLSNGSCGQCVYPLNSNVTGNGLIADDPLSCPFECHVGFYPSTTEQDLLYKCKPCTNKADHPNSYYITNGQNDAPRSCVWRCSYPYNRKAQECAPCDYRGIFPSCRNPLLSISCPSCLFTNVTVSSTKFMLYHCPSSCAFQGSHAMTLDVLLIGGGGAGGSLSFDSATNLTSRGTGGGGAGEVLLLQAVTTSSQISLTAGLGGLPTSARGNPGTLSRAVVNSVTYQVLGGGGGGGNGQGGGTTGSGGGAAVQTAPGQALGASNVFRGGLSNSNAGGGGGGSLSQGQNALLNRGGDGGQGQDFTWFFGYNASVAGGGGGGANFFAPNPIPGSGSSGGGNANQDAVPFSGSGGGGAMLYLSNNAIQWQQGGRGGSGLALVRFVDEECQCLDT